MTRSSYGHIESLGEDRHRVWWKGKPDPVTGKRKRSSKVVHGARDVAERYLAARCLECGIENDETTYGAFWDAIVHPDILKLSPNTIREYEDSWERLLEPNIASIPIKNTTSFFAESVLRDIPSPSAQKKAYKLWKRICIMATRQDPPILPYNPIDRYIRLDKIKPRKKGMIEACDVSSWMDSIRGIKAEVILLLEFGGGLSPEEACGLLGTDIRPYMRNNKLYAQVDINKALTTCDGKKLLKDTKNDFRERIQIIGAPFAERILELSETDGPLCPSNKIGEAPEVKYTSPMTILGNWKGYCERHGIDYIAPSNLRSVYATLHGEAGSPDSVVSGSMGHSDGSTKQKNYQRITRKALCEIADNLEEYIKKESE